MRAVSMVPALLMSRETVEIAQQGVDGVGGFAVDHAYEQATN